MALIDSFGLVYANTSAWPNPSGSFDGPNGVAGPIVFLPFKQVAAAVS